MVVACSTVQLPERRTPRYQSGNNGYKSPDFVAGAATSDTPLVPEKNYDIPLPPPGSDRLLLSWPVRGSLNLTRGFLLGIRPHQGLDLAAPRNTPIYAAHDGYVEYTGKDFSGFGRLIIINSGAGWATFYAHLNRIRVTEKSLVKRGQRIGDMGATGRATGVHLHFELRYNERPVDPLDYLPALK
jgi:murein DD-endopeptidase MepM/ murein hydrolase activator NlpD